MDDTARAATGTEYVDLSVVGLLRVVRRHLAIFLSILIVCAGLGVAYAFLATPYYRSQTLISPVSESSLSGSGFSQILSGFGFGSMGIRQARNSRAVGLAALSSPFFTRAFIEENNLLPVMFSDLWDAENGEWLVADRDEIPTLQEAYELFSNEIIEVEEDGLSGLVNVSIIWKDPDTAAEWANSLVENVNLRLRAQAIQDADLTIEYLTEELSKTTAIELQQSLYRLIEAEIEKRTVARVRKEFSFSVISPATPSDLDKWERPNRVFIISVGLMLGIFLGVLVALILDPTKRVLRESKQ